ncbi:MAG: hypothetical protein WBE78_08770 [Candidatus Binataceae bacterium]
MKSQSNRQGIGQGIGGINSALRRKGFPRAQGAKMRIFFVASWLRGVLVFPFSGVHDA